MNTGSKFRENRQIISERSTEQHMKPTLVIMAAGMGSRFGGLKQLISVDDAGHPIIDFSLYDARRAGFERVVFIIKHAIEADFKAAIGERMKQWFQVDYIYQENELLPEGFAGAIPEGRVKPWGTGHAVACCRDAVKGPLAVVNADDFYGARAFQTVFNFLDGPHGEHEQAMVGYRLRNTMTENGYVSRGICDVQDGYLTSITERVRIEKRGEAAAYIEDGREFPLTGDETASMNIWGFSAGMPEVLWERFPAFLEDRLRTDPLKCEYFLPNVMGQLLAEGKISVRVLPCEEVWHGMTYQEDLESVRQAVRELKAAGVYPEKLWE